MSSRHLVRRDGELDLAVPVGTTATGFRRCFVVDEETPGAVHTGFAICELDPGGVIPAHVHSYEDSFFVLGGELVVDTGDGAFQLGAGDYGVVATGAPHALRNVSDAPVRWAGMFAPQPRSRVAGDTYPVPAFPVRARRTDRCARSAHAFVRPCRPGEHGGRQADAGHAGRLGEHADRAARLQRHHGQDDGRRRARGAAARRCSWCSTSRDGLAGQHDHPFEETYLILDGAVDATFDGEPYRLEVGDIAWAGVGCVHAFSNPGPGVVRWLETQAPQPPSRHSYRFARDWEYLRAATSEEG